MSLVDDLRSDHRCGDPLLSQCFARDIMIKAADEIERLQRENATLRNFLNGIKNAVDLALMPLDDGSQRGGK